MAADRPALARHLAAFRGDSAHLVTNGSARHTVRFAAGSTLDDEVPAAAGRGSAGFAVLPGVHAGPRHGNVYLRDLHARDSVLLPCMRAASGLAAD